jgi:hypothetical protein
MQLPKALASLRKQLAKDMLGRSKEGFKKMHNRCSGALGLVLVLATSLAMSAPLLAQKENSMPKVGDMAPDFTLHYFDGSDLKAVKLSDYRGKQNVVLAFYVFAFTGG